MYTYCTIMHPLLVKKVQKCPFEDTVPLTSCCSPKGTMLALFFKSVQNKCKNVQHSPLKKLPTTATYFMHNMPRLQSTLKLSIHQADQLVVCQNGHLLHIK